MELGVNYLVGPQTLLAAIENCDFNSWPEGKPYGDGRTGEEIVRVLLGDR